uniref:Uncharacterized protein n=1 Tax=viral metagenome TaxID=1070528 RepID=A0A6M3LE76_9ZZZZ
MTEKLTTEQLKHFIGLEDDEFYVDKLRTKHGIAPDCALFHTTISRLVDSRELKRIGRGLYRKVKKLEPVKWWDDKISVDPIPFRFPRSYDDGVETSSFGIDNIVEVFPGDMVLISGQSNYGKTAIALSIMAENLDLFPTLLMGSEYTATDGKISPKFKRRMKRMNWVEWMRDGEPRFQLLPVGGDYEDYVLQDHQNVIDWISLPGDYFLIDRVMKAIKDRVGNGVAVVVLQKNKDQEYGEGGERTERYADVSIKIDAFGEGGLESLLTMGKVKSPKGRATGRMWAFSVVDWGANLHNIREMVKCHTCWGKGYVRSGQNSIRCSSCNGKKYTEKT